MKRKKLAVLFAVMSASALLITGCGAQKEKLKADTPVEKEFSLRKEEQYGTYVSLFPMGETVEGLTLEGFKYPLDHYQLKDREGLGVSNEITADTATVSWEQGVLLMIQSKD